MSGASAVWLPDGRRLHLQHGPIDMIVAVEGPGRMAALRRAVARFDTLLEELVAELPRLRAASGAVPKGETARLMARAAAPFAPSFVTPMAAVAGAGAETILAAICSGPGIDKAHVNNGGDVAFHLSAGQEITASVAGAAGASEGRVHLRAADPVRGVATSGWRGRSLSLGIADSVTVLAHGAAAADVAATLIANAVDLPAHPAITRVPAAELHPDSDLGARPVTTGVGPLARDEIARALDAGARLAETYRARGLIHAALLSLRGRTLCVGALPLLQQKDLAHA